MQQSGAAHAEQSTVGARLGSIVGLTDGKCVGAMLGGSVGVVDGTADGRGRRWQRQTVLCGWC